MFDVPHGAEDAALTSESATRFFSERTVTYIILRVSASLRHLHGAEAAAVLMTLEYKGPVAQRLPLVDAVSNKMSCSP